jgi:hypothetical protein
MLLKAVIVAAVLITVAGGGAQAATVAGGPLLIASLNDYSCSVVNISSKDLTSVVVKVTIDGGGGGATQTCAPLAPNTACTASNSAGGGTSRRFCTATVSSGKKTFRGTFCDTTAGTCVPLQ